MKNQKNSLFFVCVCLWNQLHQSINEDDHFFVSSKNLVEKMETIPFCSGIQALGIEFKSIQFILITSFLI